MPDLDHVSVILVVVLHVKQASEHKGVRKVPPDMFHCFTLVLQNQWQLLVCLPGIGIARLFQPLEQVTHQEPIPVLLDIRTDGVSPTYIASLRPRSPLAALGSATPPPLLWTFT